MKEFDYYQYGTRLIRVHETEQHFRDITPDKTTHLSSDYLKERFPDGFKFLASFDVSLDNDAFMHLYNSFKIRINNFAKSNGSRLDDEQRELICKHLEADTPFREIARKVGCNVSTVSRIAKTMLINA